MTAPTRTARGPAPAFRFLCGRHGCELSLRAALRGGAPSRVAVLSWNPGLRAWLPDWADVVCPHPDPADRAPCSHTWAMVALGGLS